MEIRYTFILIALLFLFDVLSINFSFVIISLYNDPGYDINQLGLYTTCFIPFNITWVVSSFLFQLYHIHTIQNMKSILFKSLVTFILHAVLFGLIIFFFNNVSLITIVYVLIFEILMLTMSRLTISLLKDHHHKINFYKRKIAILGYNQTGRNLRNYFMRNQMSYSFEGFFDNEINTDFNEPEDAVIGTLENFITYAVENDIKEVYSTWFPENFAGLSEVIDIAEQHCLKIRFVSDTYENNNFNYPLYGFFDGIPVLSYRVEPLELISNRIWKRFFDIVFSSIVIVFVLSWLVPILGLIIKLQSPGPIFFTQLRSGRDNKPFWCYKFRSMGVNTDSDIKQAVKGDARITKIGEFMRKTNLDEMPQFFNVLLGNMSVVGPRPHMLKHTEEYRLKVDQYMVRHFLKPGITGWAQVNGYRGEIKEDEQILRRVEHDIWYTENWSLMKDMEIVYLTVVNTVKGEENAY